MYVCKIRLISRGGTAKHCVSEAVTTHITAIKTQIERSLFLFWCESVCSKAIKGLYGFPLKRHPVCPGCMEQTVWEKMFTGHVGSAAGTYAHCSSCYFLKQEG